MKSGRRIRLVLPFNHLLKEVSHLSFEEQREILVQRFDEYKGENDRQDNVMAAGFGF